MDRKFAPPPTKYGPAAAQPKAAAPQAARSVPPPPTRFGAVAAQPKPAGGVVQPMMMDEPSYANRIGIGDQAFRSQYYFTDYDFTEGAGYYTTAVAKVNGYIFGKYYSGPAGHAEHQALTELQKVTFTARKAADMFLEPPAKNKLTIYVSKSPCSSGFGTTKDAPGCTEKILGSKKINNYEFDIKVRYGNLYVPKKMVESPKEQSEKAMKYLGTKGISTDFYDADTKKVKKVTGARKDPHPFRFIS